MTDLLQYIYYINLDHRTDRLEHLHNEFSKVNIDIHSSTVSRFPAVKLVKGHLGCTISHIKCLELAREKQYPFVCIIEDDATFVQPTTFRKKLEEFQQLHLSWDVLILGGNNCPPFQRINENCIQTFNVQTTTMYIVNGHYYDTLIANFREGLKILMKDPEANKKQYSLDIYWKHLQQSDKWYMLTPVTVIQYANYSDIEERETDYIQLMQDVDKTELIARMRKMNILSK